MNEPRTEDGPGGARPPLAGVLVADFSRVLAGPLASMFLADLGATVVKVERPGVGDDTRAWGPPYVGTTSTYYTSVNRNKRSVTLDLTDAEDVGLARRLALRSDVLIENFVPASSRISVWTPLVSRVRTRSWCTARCPASGRVLELICRATTSSCKPSAG
jgi:hypothetical protein